MPLIWGCFFFKIMASTITFLISEYVYVLFLDWLFTSFFFFFKLSFSSAFHFLVCWHHYEKFSELICVVVFSVCFCWMPPLLTTRTHEFILLELLIFESCLFFSPLNNLFPPCCFGSCSYWRLKTLTHGCWVLGGVRKLRAELVSVDNLGEPLLC